MNPTLTRWIDPNIKPVRKGWYHTGLDHNHPTSAEGMESSFNWWWDGEAWCFTKNGDQCEVQNRWWRGRRK